MNRANQKAFDIVSRVSDNVERYEVESVVLTLYNKSPDYLETSNDRPNFYSQWLFEKQTEFKTKQEYIDNQIKNYLNNLEPLTLTNKQVISHYEGDDIVAAITLKPDLIEGIDLEKVNYLTIYYKDTKKIRHYWVNGHFKNDKKSITLSCSIDNWMTYYKDFILDFKGDVKIIRKHFNRFVKRNGRLIGDYSSTSNIHNIDPQYANLTTGTVRSLGLIDIQSLGGMNQTIDNIKLTDNEILFEFYVDGKKVEDCLSNSYIKPTVGDNTSCYITGSGYPIFWSAYEQNGEIAQKSAATTYTKDGKKIQDNLFKWEYNSDGYHNTAPLTALADTNKYKAYAPNYIGKVSFSDYDYIYVVRYDTQDKKTDAYGVLVSKYNLDKDPNWSPKIINRISNVKNTIFNNLSDSEAASVSERAIAPQWRIVVATPFENTSNNIESSLTKQIDAYGVYDEPPFPQDTVVAYRYVSQPKTDQLKVYLVDLNTKNDYGRYRTMIEITGAKADFNFSKYSEQFNWKVGNRGAYISDNAGLACATIPANVHFSHGNFMGITAKNSVGVVFNGYISENKTYPSERRKIGCYTTTTIVEQGLENVEGNLKNIMEYPITEWNKTSTVDVKMTNEIVQPEWNDLMEPLKMRFSPVIYEKNADYDEMREPQIKMGHCIKHFIDYLGVRKQIFLEFGNIDYIKINQTILPQGAVDKIYYTDTESDYNQWELAMTNGFLTKQYDNSIPMISDSYNTFMIQNQAQLQNGYLTATNNLDFAKQQATINNNALTQKKNAFGLNSGISFVSSILGLGIAGKTFNSEVGPLAAMGSISMMEKSIANFATGFENLKVMEQQTELNNKKNIFNAEQQVKQIDAMVQDKFNQPDQLNQGSVEVNTIMRYQQELTQLFKNYGNTPEPATFKIDTQAPTKTSLCEYSQFLNQYGYISNNLYLNQSIDTLNERTRFNFIQLADIQNMFHDVKLNQQTKNYFMNLFNQGVRLWNMDYENQKMCDYSKENWEINIEKEAENGTTDSEPTTI